MRPLIVGEMYSYVAHGRTFVLSKLSRCTYHLRDTAVQERSRFGTKEEIVADMAVTLETGHLPPPNGTRW